MAKGAKTIDRDKGARRIIANAKALSGAYVTVGIHEKAGQYTDAEGAGLPVAQVAFWNEFGTRMIPARSFLRAAVDEARAALTKYRTELKMAVLTQGLSTDDALGKLGFRISQLIRNKILSNVPPANAPATLERKVGTKTLVDSRLLSRSVSWEVGRDE